jgi:O-antigen ligase
VFAIRQFRLIPALTFAAAAAAAVVLAGPARVQALDSQETSAQSRIEAWGDGLMMIKADPLFGVGYGRFTEYHYQVAHNSFVQAAAELGMVGAVVLVGMFATLFRTLRIARQAPSRPDALPASWVNAMTAAAGGMVICCFFLSRQYVSVPYIMLALGGSMGSLVPGAPPPPLFPPVVESGFKAVALTLVTMLLVYVMVRTLGAW